MQKQWGILCAMSVLFSVGCSNANLVEASSSPSSSSSSSANSSFSQAISSLPNQPVQSSASQDEQQEPPIYTLAEEISFYLEGITRAHAVIPEFDNIFTQTDAGWAKKPCIVTTNDDSVGVYGLYYLASEKAVAETAKKLLGPDFKLTHSGNGLDEPVEDNGKKFIYLPELCAYGFLPGDNAMPHFYVYEYSTSNNIIVAKAAYVYFHNPVGIDDEDYGIFLTYDGVYSLNGYKYPPPPGKSYTDYKTVNDFILENYERFERAEYVLEVGPNGELWLRGCKYLE